MTSKSSAPPAAAEAAARAIAPAVPPRLTGKQRRFLRARAHSERPVVHVGEAGVSEAVLAATDAALESHELVKVRLHAPEDKKAAAQQLADATGAALCGLVGHTVILYRPRRESPLLELPER